MRFEIRNGSLGKNRSHGEMLAGVIKHKALKIQTQKPRQYVSQKSMFVVYDLAFLGNL